MTPLLLLVASYLAGAIPTSYLAGRLGCGIDLRQHGSGNLGATNAFRVLGWKLALPVLLVDLLKGWAPTWYFPQLDGRAPAAWALAYATAAVLGHVFSVFVGFRGGKGVATSAGALLALAPVAVGVGLALWGVIVLATGIVSLASILAAATVPAVVFVTHGTGGVFWLCLALGAFIVYAHRANIRRLLRGEEHRFGRAKGAAEP